MESFARYLPSRSFIYLSGSLALAALLVWSATLLEKKTAGENGLAVVEEKNLKDASQNLGKLIEKRAFETAPDTSVDWRKEFAAITEKPINPSKDLGPLTLTDILARSVFSEYAKNQEEGALVPGSQQKIVEEALSKISLAFTRYSSKDLLVSEDSGVVALKNYGNSLGEVIISNSTQNQNEVYLLSLALAQNNQSRLASLTPIAEAYRKLLTESLRTVVPAGALAAHLSLVNSLSTLSETIPALQSAFSDPVKTILYLNEYQNNVKNLAAAFGSLKKVFDKAGISFNTEEPGALLNSFARNY